MFIVLFSILFLFVGILLGIIGNEKYNEYLNYTTHEFEKLFQDNPHPEIFDKDGNIDRGDYIALNFELGYDPEDFDPEDLRIDN